MLSAPPWWSWRHWDIWHAVRAAPTDASPTTCISSVKCRWRRKLPLRKQNPGAAQRRRPRNARRFHRSFHCPGICFCTVGRILRCRFPRCRENLPLRKNKGKKYQEKKYQDSLPSHSPIYPSSSEKFVGILEWNTCLAKYKRQVEYDTLLFDHPEWKGSGWMSCGADDRGQLLPCAHPAHWPVPGLHRGGAGAVCQDRYVHHGLHLRQAQHHHPAHPQHPAVSADGTLSRTVHLYHDYDARVRWDFHGQN